MGLLDKIFGTYSDRELKRIEPIKQKVLSYEDRFKNMPDDELKGMTAQFKARLKAGETLDDIMPEALAVCREAADRVLGKRAFPVQIVGAIVLHQGRIAEMKTGEGKTLTACLAAYVNALTGEGVHVVTVNDYLAKFQGDEMGRVYKYLGLSIGVLLSPNGQMIDYAARRAAYACDITYGTNLEFGFDYLRDNMAKTKDRCVQRGHTFAIVDEVDSILIDEARTPLLISENIPEDVNYYDDANFVKGLTPKVITETDTKVDIDTDSDKYDYIVDQKAKTATLTARGVKKAEEHYNIDNLSDADNVELLHRINIALIARSIKIKGVDYIVKEVSNGSYDIVIIDVFTGRLKPDTVFGNNVHQAVRAKEHIDGEKVEVKYGSHTVATITYQNYFRMYKKLSGMTGTAATEEAEFREIYKLDVVVVPTNKPMIRIDHPDIVYKNEEQKFNAVVEQVAKCHEKGQPVLVGTVSVEKSEKLSKLLTKKGIKHNVLNAKYHEKEAEIVAQAGQLGAVTVSTNMAGRGTDIILGGNAEQMATSDITNMRDESGELLYTDDEIFEITGKSQPSNDKIREGREKYNELLEKYTEEYAGKAELVKEAGGLFVIGTERHESRRIDNQLRGRSGRQGDIGESRFFLALDDDLLRLFGGDRVSAMMNSLNYPDGQPIDAKIISSTVEFAQKKVEGRNFTLRKNVLNYDDVMNAQRETIYSQRAKVLNGEDVRDYILKMIRDFVTDSVNTYLSGDEPEYWNILGLKEHFGDMFADSHDFTYTPQQLDVLSREDLIKDITENALKKYDEKCRSISESIVAAGKSVVEDAGSIIVDGTISVKDYLSQTIPGFDPPVRKYPYEIYRYFASSGIVTGGFIPVEALSNIDGDAYMRFKERETLLRTVDEKWEQHIADMDDLRRGMGLRSYGSHDPFVAYRMEGFDMFDAMVASICEDTVRSLYHLLPVTAAPRRIYIRKMKLPPIPIQPAQGANGTVRKTKKVGRNDPCPCGSGLKYKKCCGRNE